ncbi:MAG: hypothetical protein COW05_02010 [Gammaproteobacteria bacterium CG12_big_fil_rev_8_21_14_0_65_46_12]|nr:MAG: hypothetical protein COW05_02010 [Gammaproteobacteria bacterium CG12_big_fil_rev_8_21_14_0_65_46_12]
MNTPYAILAGLLLIALAVYFKTGAPSYQLENFSPGVVARMDTKTGTIDLCGRVEAVVDTAHMLADIDEGVPRDVIIPKLMDQIRKTRCFSLATPPIGTVK